MFQEWQPHDIYPTLGDLVKRGYKIFDDSWDTHVKEHKSELCNKIIRYYYFNQIGAETPERFIWYINEQLARIMPYYNQLYASELIKFNPMLNHSITSNGRSIENLLKSLSTDTVKTNKIIRDFVTENSTFGDITANTGVKSTDNLDKTVSTVYNKEGTDDSTTVTNEITHEDQDKWIHTTDEKDRTLDEDVNTHFVGNEKAHSVTTTDSDKTMTDKKDIDIGVIVDSTEKDTGTVVDDGVGTSKSVGTKDWTEVKHDVSKTVVKTDLDETTNSSARKDYADTPQIDLRNAPPVGSGAGAGFPNVHSDYLTNVTWDYGTTTHALDSTVTTDYTDDENKTHTEKTSDDTDTTKKNTQTTDRTKKGDSTTTTDHTEDNNGTEDFHSATVVDSTVDKVENTDKTTHAHEVTTDEINTHEHLTDDKEVNSTETYDDDWTEKGNGDEITTSRRVGTSDTSAKTKSLETKSGRENVAEEGGSSNISKENTERTTDTGTTDITTGYMNIPSSALLEAFRKTFLNIDQRIIDDLRENFLSVF